MIHQNVDSIFALCEEFLLFSLFFSFASGSFGFSFFSDLIMIVRLHHFEGEVVLGFLLFLG
jgi:hypothetical protein